MTWYADYLQSPHWKAVRTVALYWAGRRCQVCNSDDSPEVHHRTYERVGAEQPADVTVLCGTCHYLYHKRAPAVPETDPRDGPDVLDIKPPKKVFGYDD